MLTRERLRKVARLYAQLGYDLSKPLSGQYVEPPQQPRRGGAGRGPVVKVSVSMLPDGRVKFSSSRFRDRVDLELEESAASGA